jgi:hypothetical protein
MPRVALIGSSLALASVEAALTDVGDLDLLRVPSPCDEVAMWVKDFAPDLLIFDLAAGLPQCTQPYLAQQPGLGLIGFDLESHKMLLLSGEHTTLSTTDDLVRAVRKLTAAGNPGGVLG